MKKYIHHFFTAVGIYAAICMIAALLCRLTSWDWYEIFAFVGIFLLTEKCYEWGKWLAHGEREEAAANEKPLSKATT